MRILVHEWINGGGLAGLPLPESLRAEGSAMRNALAADFASVDGVEVLSTLDDRFEEADPRWTTALVPKGEEEAILARLARECECTVVVAPETGGVLRKRAELLASVGARSLGSEASAIALTSDKRSLHERLTGLGVPVPPLLCLDRVELDRCFPMVLKPRVGAGCIDTFLIEGPNDRNLLDKNSGEWIGQRFVSGVPMSASYFVGRGGEVALIGVGWQRLRCDSGRFRYLGGILPAPGNLGFGPPMMALQSVPGLRGFVGVDFIQEHETGETTVLEINSRVTTSFVGWRALLGTGNLARAWLGLAGLAEIPASSIEKLSADDPRFLRFDANGSIENISCHRT